MKSWLKSRFGDVRSAKSGSELRVCCPFCKARVGRADTKFHMYVSTTKHVAHCFRCDWAGNWISLIMSVDGCSYGEAITNIRIPKHNVGEFDNLAPYSPMGLVRTDTTLDVPDGYMPLLFRHNKNSPEYCVEEQAVWRYLDRRDVPESMVTSHFGWIPGTQRAWCLIDKSWWQGRLIVPGEPKYLSPPWPKGDALWNADALERYGSITICEGVFSAIATGPNAIALCGKTITDEQAGRIVAAHPKHITVMLDADARRSVHGIIDALWLAGYAGGTHVQYMEDGDPADGVRGAYVEWDFEEKIRNLII